MSDDHIAYYLAAGRSLDAVNEWIERRKVAQAAFTAFAREQGAEACQVLARSGGRALAGLIFAAGVTPPPVWRKSKREGCWVPTTRTKEGKLLAKRMREMPQDCFPDAIRRMHFGSNGNGMFMYGTGIRRIGDEWILSCHKDAEPMPDAIPLKRSEYWAKVEASPEPEEATRD